MTHPRGAAANAGAIVLPAVLLAGLVATYGCRERGQSDPTADNLQQSTPASETAGQQAAKTPSAQPPAPAKQQATSHAVPHITSPDDFRTKVLRSARPVLVDFYADWCPPCRRLAPTIEKIHSNYAGRADVYKIDVNKAGALASKYGIRAIPTVIIFNDGEAVHRWTGLMPEATYTRALDKLVK